MSDSWEKQFHIGKLGILLKKDTYRNELHFKAYRLNFYIERELPSKERE